MHGKAAWFALVLSTIVSAEVQRSRARAEDKDLGRGKRWVRSHPFHLSALTQSDPLFDVDEYRGAGLDTLMAWKLRPGLFEKSVAAGLPIHYHMHQNAGKTAQDYVEHVRGIVEKYPGLTGLLFHDEPKTPAMEHVGKVSGALKKAFPDLLVHSNAMPKGAPRPSKYGFGDDAPSDFYAAYVEHFARLVQGDVLMVDIYPLGQDGGHSRVYFETLALFRRQGLKYGVPYWIFVQAYDHGGRKRRPSESDLRFQLFTSLAFGFTGISYFTYDPALGAGLIDEKKNRTPLYYHAGRANREVTNLGKALRYLDSTGIAFVLGRHEVDGKMVQNDMPPMPPPGPWVWPEVESRPRRLLGAEVEGLGRGRDALLGFFEDDRGDEYFMVTNLRHEKGISAADCAQTITLTFAPGVKIVTRLSRETGVSEQLFVREGILKLRLPGGTGDLFKLGDGEFPGLDEGK